MRTAWKITQIALFIAIVFVTVRFGGEKVYAGTWDNAYSYYSTYGNETVFRATTQTDGLIYCATRGAVASSGIKYRTVGWKMDVQSSSGELLQSIYFQLGGSYLNNISTVQEGNYIYRLYAISLLDIKGRMSDRAKSAMEQGNCVITLNACMTVTRNGVPQGSINDQGVITGRVYTTYAGIVSAESWTAASRAALTSYYDKKVTGLFYSVSVSKGTGISSVSGAGTYCYGTYVTISAVAADGYEFSHWSGSNTVYSCNYGFYVNGDSSWTAYGVQKKTVVTFYRNRSSGDTTTKQQTFTFGTGGQYFGSTGFSRTGYHMLGWAHTDSAASARYTVNQSVSSDWIRSYYPSVSLYAVWEANAYQIVFDGNGAPSGSVAAIRTAYGKTETMPKNGFAKPEEISSFLGWSLSKESLTPDYVPGDKVSVSALAKASGVENQNGAVITLYAVWDYAPVIEAYDLFYSLEDAQNGVITEAELGTRAKAEDREDGDILYGDSGSHSLKVTDYDPEQFTGCTSDAVITVTYEAVDSAGNRVERSINVYVVDTKVQSGSAVTGKIRLIDQKYFEDGEGNLVSESEGGLKDTSRWSCDETLRTILREALQKANLPAVSPEV